MLSEKIRHFEVYNGQIRRQINLFDNQISYINLLSVYDMLRCEKMAKVLTTEFMTDSSQPKPAIDVLENACLGSMCLTDELSNRIFSDPAKLMKKITAEDLLSIVKEYNSLRKDYMGFDEFNDIEFEDVKKN